VKILFSLVMVSLLATVQASALDVLVTVLPHASLIERLGGGAVTVHVLVGPGESPATFDPTPHQLQRLAPSQVWFTTGAPLEAALEPRLDSMIPGLEVVATHADLAPLTLCDHHHEGEHHDHGETDPHVWLSLRNTARQATIMAAGLERHLPDQAPQIKANLATLLNELTALDAELTTMLAPIAGRTLLVFHPAFGYFAHDYGLVQKAVEQGGLAPSPRHLTQLLMDVEAQGVRTVFVQPQSSDRAIRPIAQEAGLEVLVLDPLARDHLANLRHLGVTILAGLEDPS